MLGLLDRASRFTFFINGCLPGIGLWSVRLSGRNPLLVEELSLDIVVPIGVRQHLIRDAWRGWMLSQHAAGERRDAECVDEILVNGSWSNIDWRP